MTLSDRVLKLEELVASQSAQQEATNNAVDSLKQDHRETAGSLESTRRELERKVAVLEEKVSKLEEGQSAQRITVLEEKVSKLEATQNMVAERLWLIIAPLFAAVIGSVLTWLLIRKTP